MGGFFFWGGGGGGGIHGGRQLVEITEFVFSTGRSLRMTQKLYSTWDK